MERKDAPLDIRERIRDLLQRTPFATLEQIAVGVGCSTPILRRWRTEDPELDDLIRALRADNAVDVDRAMVEAAQAGSVGAAQLVMRRAGTLDTNGRSDDDSGAQRYLPQIVINVAAVPRDHVQRIRDIRGEAEREAPNILPGTNPGAEELLPGSRFVPIGGLQIRYIAPDPEAPTDD